MLAVVLALASSAVYGLSDFLGGLKSRSTPLLGVLLVSQGTALVLVAILVLAVGDGPPATGYLLFAVLAGASEAIGVAALYRGLAVGTMGVVAPVAATTPVVPVVVGIALGELPAPVQVVGIALAVVGIVLTARAGAPPDRRDPPDQAGAPDRDGPVTVGVAASILFGLLASLGFGTFYVAMDAASEGDVPWALLVARVSAVAIFVGAACLSRARLGLRRADGPVLASIGVLIVGADATFALASNEGLLGVVAVLSSLYPLVTIGLARAYLHERLARRQRIGVAACLVGAVALSAG